MATIAPTSIIDPFPQQSLRRASISEESNAILRRFSVGSANRLPTYHQDKKAKYCLPNDFEEHVRLETQAVHLSAMMDRQVLHAPVSPSAKRCLDIGCGTGIVTGLLSEKFKEADCVGLDLSRVPDLRDHNERVRFFQGNVIGQRPTEWIPNSGNSGLTQDKDLFDYMFSRLLILGMSDWSNFVKKEFELLKPGGWAEIHDLSWDWLDENDTNISANWSWLECLRKDLEDKKGLDVHCGEKAKKWMGDAGFVDVQVFKYWYPACGTSEATLEMREFGKFNATSIPPMLHHAIARAMPDESPELIEQMRAEMRRSLLPESGLHQYFYVTIGRKPE